MKGGRSSLPTFADMKIVFVLPVFLVCLSAKAQFHTVARRQPVCRIDTEKDFPKVEKVSDKKKEAGSMPGKFPDYGHSEWVQRYMSVSYPLKRIAVTSPYGLRTDPFGRKRRRHNGIDLRAENEEAYAMLSGVVVKVGQDKCSGKFVTLCHGDYTVSYCHLSQVLVRQGASVMPGEVIAITGNTGHSTGPHLHLTCKHRNRYINPDILLLFVRETKEEAIARLDNL